MVGLPSMENGIQWTVGCKHSAFSTSHELLHILEEVVDDAESLGCSDLKFVLCKSVQLLYDRHDVLVLKKFLYIFDCDTLSKVTCQRELTY